MADLEDSHGRGLRAFSPNCLATPNKRREFQGWGSSAAALHLRRGVRLRAHTRRLALDTAAGAPEFFGPCRKAPLLWN
jgi:hypothetical protein